MNWEKLGALIAKVKEDTHSKKIAWTSKLGLSYFTKIGNYRLVVSRQNLSASNKINFQIIDSTDNSIVISSKSFGYEADFYEINEAIYMLWALVSGELERALKHIMQELSEA